MSRRPETRSCWSRFLQWMRRPFSWGQGGARMILHLSPTPPATQSGPTTTRLDPTLIEIWFDFEVPTTGRRKRSLKMVVLLLSVHDSPPQKYSLCEQSVTKFLPPSRIATPSLMKHSYDQRYIARNHVKSSGPHGPISRVAGYCCQRKERTRRGDGILDHNVKAHEEKVPDMDSRHEKVFHEKPRPWRYPATPRNTFPVSLPSSSSRTPPPAGSTHNIPLLGPPLIHRITSSSPRPALSYERIGDPSLGIFKLRLPKFMIDTLDDVVALAENHVATTRQGSWKTELYSLTRQDMAMRQIPGMKALIDPVLDYLTKTMEAMYGCRQVLMDQNQPHILKYSIDSRHTGGM